MNGVVIIKNTLLCSGNSNKNLKKDDKQFNDIDFLEPIIFCSNILFKHKNFWDIKFWDPLLFWPQNYLKQILGVRL